jgi:hypothetical protein
MIIPRSTINLIVKAADILARVFVSIKKNSKKGEVKNDQSGSVKTP